MLLSKVSARDCGHQMLMKFSVMVRLASLAVSVAAAETAEPLKVIISGGFSQVYKKVFPEI